MGHPYSYVTNQRQNRFRGFQNHLQTRPMSKLRTRMLMKFEIYSFTDIELKYINI